MEEIQVEWRKGRHAATATTSSFRLKDLASGLAKDDIQDGRPSVLKAAFGRQYRLILKASESRIQISFFGQKFQCPKTVCFFKHSLATQKLSTN